MKECDIIKDYVHMDLKLRHPIFLFLIMSINQTCSCHSRWTNRKVCRKSPDKKY